MCLFRAPYDLFHPTKANKLKWSVWIDMFKSSLFHPTKANKPFFKSQLVPRLSDFALCSLCNFLTVSRNKKNYKVPKKRTLVKS